MVHFLKQYTIFYVTALLIVLLGFLGLAFSDKGDVVLALDANSTKVLDYLFFGITKMGEVLGGAIIVGLLAIYSKKKYILIFAISVICSLIVSQSLKHTVFKNENRPSATYKELHDIDWVHRHTKNSFPSGHTSAAFTFFTVLAIGIKKRGVQLVAPLAAALVGISRVYLGQHYFNDVVVGAVLGIFLTTVVAILVERKYKKS